MASQKPEPTRRQLSKGKWSAQEDEKLTEAVAAHGAKKWTSIASKAGLNRNGKSCRLRWINYLSPDVKRGGFSDQEEDLIIRLHKLLGNRWALIAARLPGRTDNEVKNYWNSHLRKRINQKEKQSSNGANLTVDGKPSVADADEKVHVEVKQEYSPSKVGTSAALIKEEVMVKSEDCDVNTNNFGVDDFFNLIDEEPFSLGGSGSTNFFI